MVIEIAIIEMQEEAIDNGTHAPGTILNDCIEKFRRRFAEADLIVAKGQGNFETLSNNPSNILCLFKVKCGVIANLVNQPIGMQMLIHSQLGLGQKC
ncbi:MAG: ARMT1-like domain-containing protein [Pseudanabaena sp.]